MRIPSGVTDQYIYFVAVDSTDLKTRETGLSSFTVYRSRNGAAAAAMTTPTINETDSTNMPGVYELLLDEDMTIGSGNDTEEMCFHITATGMAPVTRTIELYRSKITAGNTLGVEADGDLTKVNELHGHTVQTGDSFARLGAPAGASIAADLATIDSEVGTVDTVVDAIKLSTDNLPSDPADQSLIIAATNAIKGDTAAILADTGEIGAAGAGLTAVPWNSAWDTEVQSECTDALNAYDPPTRAELTSDINGLNDLSAAQVNAEVLDVLNVDTFGEPTGVPGDTVTLRTMLGYIYKAVKNRIDITSSKKTFYNNAGSAEWEKDLSDDGTTYSESKGNTI